MPKKATELLPGYEWLRSRTGRAIAAIDWRRMIMHWRHGEEEEFIDLEARRRQSLEPPTREGETP